MSFNVDSELLKQKIKAVICASAGMAVAEWSYRNTRSLSRTASIVLNAYNNIHGMNIGNINMDLVKKIVQWKRGVEKKARMRDGTARIPKIPP